VNVEKVKGITVEAEIMGRICEVRFVENSGVQITGLDYAEFEGLVARLANGSVKRLPSPSLPSTPQHAPPGGGGQAALPAPAAAPPPKEATDGAPAPSRRSVRAVPQQEQAPAPAAPQEPAKTAKPAPAPRAVAPAPAKPAPAAAPAPARTTSRQIPGQQTVIEEEAPEAEDEEDDEDENEEEPEQAAAEDDELDPRLTDALKVREVVQVLIEQGKTTKAALIDECRRIQKRVPVLSRITALDARIEQAAGIYGIE
jgi:hypothetical protein